MNILLKLSPLLLSLGKLAGQSLLALIMSLITGRTFKSLILWPFQKWAQKSTNPEATLLVEEAQKDLGVDALPPPPPPPPGGPNG